MQKKFNNDYDIVLIEAGVPIQAGAEGTCSNRSRGLLLEVLRWLWYFQQSEIIYDLSLHILYYF